MKRETIVAWSPWDETGFEDLRLTFDDDRIVADGIILKAAGYNGFRIHYRIHCQPDWKVREVMVSLLGDHHTIKLHTDGTGRWSDESGDPILPLNDCVGVDISATPFTNTLAIHQLDLKPGESAEIVVAYIAAPQMQVTPSRQRYTCLELKGDGGLYRYEDVGLFSGFAAELEVDPLGLVINYPRLFKRQLVINT